jgi:hypothetical protein
MRPRVTNTNVATHDVYDLSFESAGAPGLGNEHSGLAVRPARYIVFAEPGHARPSDNLSLLEVNYEVGIEQ